ncbi:retrovirus-related pol polyprotein from transposon TNT 1-94 [Tanacetum coccineum]
MDDLCREKGIRREYSVARTPQQNGVAKRRNRTLTEAARTMLADSKLPIAFWAEAVSTACYVHNRVLVVKPHNKTPCELFRGLKPVLNFMRPFGCHVTILNTLENLGKFDGKSDEGFFVKYSLSSKAFRVYNTRTRRVEENLHIGFLENKPMIEGNGPKWLFDIDSLTQSMNYVPVAAGTITNESTDASYFDSPSKDVHNGEPKSAANDQKQVEDGPDNENDKKDKSEDDSNTKEVNVAVQHVNTPSPEVNIVDPLIEPTSITKTLSDSSWVEAMHEELLQFKLQHVWILVDLPRKRAIGTKWVFRNKKDERGIMIRNKARLVAQSHRQEEGIDYEEFFALVARIETIRLFLAYVSFMGFLVYQMDVKSAFLYGTIEEEVYVTQPPGFKDPDNLDKVYKVVKALYGLHQGDNLKDGDADDVDVHLYRSMIGSLMYLTASRPDIMFAKSDGFRYLKGIPTLGLWYSRDSPFELVAYTDSDYAGATLDRKSTIGGTPIKGREELTIEESKNIYGTDGGKEEKHLLHSETRKELPPLTNYHHHMAQQETSNDHQNVM